jgi:hypothetical protein
MKRYTSPKLERQKGEGPKHERHSQNSELVSVRKVRRLPDANGPRVSFCVRTDGRTPATEPSDPTQTDQAIRGDPFAAQIWAENALVWARDGQHACPPLLVPCHQLVAPRPIDAQIAPPLLPFSPKPCCDAPACPGPCHIRRPPFKLLLIGGHSSAPSSLRATAGTATCPVLRPSPQPRPPVTTPRTCSIICHADFEVRTSSMFICLRQTRLCPGPRI